MNNLLLIRRQLMELQETEGACLTFVAQSAFLLSCVDTSGASGKGWDSTMEYSTDKSTWETWDGAAIQSSSESNGNYYLYIRGQNNSRAAGYSEESTTGFVWKVTNANGDLIKFKATGNIENLLNYKTVQAGKHPLMGYMAFSGMFMGTYITEGPNLPTLELTEGCYAAMYYQCHYLQKIPDLPATTLKENCYFGMFAECLSLKLSETSSSTYYKPYKIPSQGVIEGDIPEDALTSMFMLTMGSFSDTPEVNTTYYMSDSETGYLSLSSPDEFQLESYDYFKYVYMGEYVQYKCWDGTIEYSTDKVEWKEWSGTEAISSKKIGNISYLYLRGKNRYITKYLGGNQGAWKILKKDSEDRELATNVSVSGNIMTLLNYEAIYIFQEITVWESALAYLFYYNKIITAPQLPATTLYSNCYQSMFEGCDTLIEAPDLPATSVKSYSYKDMFKNCTSLKRINQLSATSVGSHGCEGMFEGCINLRLVPNLSITSFQEDSKYCCKGMFKNCSSLEVPPNLLATTLVDYCYTEMFSGCTKLNLQSSVANPYRIMPYKIPSGDNDTISNVPTGALDSMFSGAGIGTPDVNKTYYFSPSKFGEIVILSSQNFTVDCYNSSEKCYVKGWDGTMEYSTDRIHWKEWNGLNAISATADTGMIYRLYIRGIGNTYVSNKIEENSWRILTNDSYTTDVSILGNIENLLDYKVVLNDAHPTIKDYAFANLFENNLIIQGPDLLTETLTAGCYMDLFSKCTALVVAPVITAVIMGDSSCERMFYGCTQLNEAPDLSTVTTLNQYCYHSMFEGCKELSIIPELKIEKLASGCYWYMFANCIDLATLPDLPANELPSCCYSHMFDGCGAIKLYEDNQIGYTNFRIPQSGKIKKISSDSLTDMFANTGGSVTGTPKTETDYYYPKST